MRIAIGRSFRACVSICAVILVVAVAQPLEAQGGPRRARLSRDVADRLASHVEASTDVIVAAGDTALDQLALRYGARLKRRISGGAVFEVTGGQLEALSQDADVAHLAGDVPVQRMGVTAEATGADQVWKGLAGIRGATGRGIGVAVIDSGIAPHAALRARVVASVDFPAGAYAPLHDEYGHGTHVAGLIAGSDVDGYGGMAPNASLINLHVLGADGSGKTSDVIDAIDWAVAHRDQFNIRVINLSLGHPVQESYLEDPLCQAAQRAIDAGIIVVAAAGNLGKMEDGRPIVGGIVSPGNTPSVLTVGAMNTKNTPQRSDDVMATYSSRGPTAIDGDVKPDLVAPGNLVVSAAAADSYLTTTYPEHVVAGKGQRAYMELSGTSMATAVVSGAAALVLESRPRLTPAQVKVILQLTSSRLAGAGLIEEGAGSLNVLGAVALVRGVAPTRVTVASESYEPAGTFFAQSSNQTRIVDTSWRRNEGTALYRA